MLTEEKLANNSIECFGRLTIGLNRLAQGGIDAILLDLGLPDSQGINTFEKTYAVAPKVPILILTANDNDEIALEAVSKGAQDYLIKGKSDGALLIRAINYSIERKKKEEKLRESRDKIEILNEKLHVAGQLTRHDALNKLGVIVGQIFLLNEKYADCAEIVYHLGKIQRACSTIGTIFDFAKMYERLGVEELTYVDVEKAVDETAVLFPDLTSKVVNDCQGLRLLADSFLRQLFYNLIDNTRKYGKKTTTIRVYYEKADQDSLKLVYEDNGVGVPLENKPLLFKEGFSTGGSTGYGLFLIKKMIEVYGWKIEENGEPGIGAKFVISIPMRLVSISEKTLALKYNK
jgi:signal transduction histidine kinase